MKITRLQINGWLAVADIDIRIDRPIALFAGKNGASKSGVGDAIKFAIGRKNQPVRGVTQKKDYDQLLHDGARAGGAVVTINDNMAESFSFTIPKGDFGGPEVSEAMRVALDGQRFAKMDDKERRAFIMSMGAKRLSPDIVQPILLEKLGAGHADKVQQAMQQLLVSAEAAVKYAGDEATKQKGAWRLITNQVWGTKVGPDWKAPVPDMPTGDLAALKQELADHETYFAGLNETVGTIKATQQQAQNDAQRRASLSAAANRVPELETLLSAAIAERDAFQTQVEAMRERAKGGKQGLVHDLMRFVESMTPLTAERATTQALLRAAYIKEHGPITAAGVADAEAAAGLPEHERGLQVLVNRAANLQRDLDAAKTAKAQYDALGETQDAMDVSAELAEVNALIEAARAKKITLSNKVLDFEAAANGRAAAAKKTTDAGKLHADIIAWLEIAAQLSPDGIAANLLADALAPINVKLAQAAADTDWPQVVIHPDMSITIGKRTYLMESKSFQWRADVMIAQAVSEVSGLKCLLLDECDILDIPSRGVLFGWLDMLVEYGSLDSAILMATLKAIPTGMPESFQLQWINGGAIAPEAEAA